MHALEGAKETTVDVTLITHFCDCAFGTEWAKWLHSYSKDEAPSSRIQNSFPSQGFTLPAGRSS